MSLKELIEAARRRTKDEQGQPADYTAIEDGSALADFASRLLLSLDVEAVKRFKAGYCRLLPGGVEPGYWDPRRDKDVTTISAAVIAALGE